LNYEFELSAENRRKELKAFLVERRRRLQADGPRGRQRAREGLSQAEIAELAAVSLNWYELFESGRGDRRVSVDFVARIAKAMQLDFDDRIELYRLALPETHILDELQQRTEMAASSVLRAIPGLLERMLSVSGIDEILAIAADSMNAALHPDYATMATVRNDEGLLGFATGPQAQSVCNATHHMFWDAYADLPKDQVGIIESMPGEHALPIGGHDVQIVAVAGENRNVLRSWGTLEHAAEHSATFPARSSLAVPIHEGDVLRALLGALWLVPRRFSRIELETARAIVAIVGLVSKRIS